MARIVEIHPDQEGVIHHVKVQTSSGMQSKRQVYNLYSLEILPDNNNLDIDTTHQIEKPGHSNNVPDDKKSVVVESQPKRSLDKKLDQQIKR